MAWPMMPRPMKATTGFSAAVTFILYGGKGREGSEGLMGLQQQTW
jgi:hypothetical protein